MAHYTIGTIFILDAGLVVKTDSARKAANGPNNSLGPMCNRTGSKNLVTRH